MRYALSLLLLGSVASAANIDRELARADAKHARAFVKLADKAFKADQKATARMLYERALALDPSNSKARRALGFKRAKGEWAREREAAGDVARWRDTDRITLKEFRAERRVLETRRTAEWVKICAKEPARLKPLLRFSPRDAALHAALGHKNGVRPELEIFAATMRERLASWHGSVETTVKVARGVHLASALREFGGNIGEHLRAVAPVLERESVDEWLEG